VAQAGFAAAYASGGAIARSCGIPDLGLLSLAEIAQRLEQIVDVVDTPVIADADNGYGNALNAQRAAHAFERAGVAAFHIEDQTFLKRCGHYADKSVVPVAERKAPQSPDHPLIRSIRAPQRESFCSRRSKPRSRW
jgi:2-methylisocitrate lyase-like PEP mutase family enzyme